ncbi:hypothetical protein DXG01_006780 [Tephrocybe rancida]|nr:hypothetical protein DXG01_006780 [Tephrocybe rancida]
MTDTNSFNVHLLRVLTAVLQDNTGTIPFDLVSDIANDDTTGTSAAILEGLEALVDRVRHTENQKSQVLFLQIPTFSSSNRELTFLRVVYPQAQAQIRVLKTQAEDVRRACEAVADSNLKQRMDIDGTMPELGITVNVMVGQVSAIASEVMRVSLEAGKEGRLGGQVELGEVKGAWKSLADNMNLMALSLTNQTRCAQEVAKAVVGGDFTIEIKYDAWGELLELKEVVNGMTEFFSDLVDEITMVAREVGGEGRLGGQLTLQTRLVSAITSALAQGEIPRQISGLAVNGEMRSLVDSPNHMIDQLVIFASEISKVAREVGTQGKLGVRAEVRNAQGIWQEITVLVNTLAEIIFTQLRGFAQITAAALNHDFMLFPTDKESGKMDSLKTQINLMMTPVEGIIVAVERTLEGELEPAQMERILLVWRHVKTLLPVSDDILRISKD